MSYARPASAGVVGLCLAVAAAAAQAPAPDASASAASAVAAESTALQPKIAPVLSFILGKIISEAVKRDSDKPNGLFNQLKTRLGFGDKPKDEGPASDGLTPAVGYAIQQLDPVSFELLAPLKVGDKPTKLKTGDVFALQYSTNLPGQIRLENINPAGRVSDLGTYTVQVDQLNRLPRERGIRLEGEPGLEILKLYFFPCIPPESEGQASMEPFKSQLPVCGAGPNTQVASAGNAVQTRSLVNLSQPEATMAFAGLTEYRTNEVTMAVVQIQHEKPGDGK